MNSFEKILIKYLKNILKIPEDVEIEFSDTDKGYRDGHLTFNVDLSKIDKNSGSYDEDYARLFRKPKLKGFPSFTYAWSNKIESVINEFKKISGSKQSHYYYIDNNLINYDYLDSVDKKIKQAISKTDFPNVDFEWEKDGNNPHIKLIFSNFTTEEFSNTNEFKSQLQSILGADVDLNEYTLAYRKPRG